MTAVDVAYEQALDYIYSFIDFSLKRNLRNAEAHFKLERMVNFMHILGDPQKAYKIIHVAGTKGKGSVCAMCASVLQQAGYKVGLYTSPHLEEFSERIQVNGQHINKEAVVYLVERLKEGVKKVQDITTFELTTALGFLYFKEKQVDVAVVEVGLGGRLDATNIVDPLVSVITSISLDHTAVLGNTLKKIAFEKGGIIKQNRPVVIAPQSEDARKVLMKLAKEKSAPIIEVGFDVKFSPENHTLHSQTLKVWETISDEKGGDLLQNQISDRISPLNLEIPLLGYHQVINAATAYAALRQANREGLSVQDNDIQQGFQNTVWPARFEILNWNPILIVDSAHNTDSARRLINTLQDYFPGRSVCLIFGASADKDIKGMLTELVKKSFRIITSQSIHPRAMDASAILDNCQDLSIPTQAIVPIENALQTALAEVDKDDIILATGSVFVAAAIRAIWRDLEN